MQIFWMEIGCFLTTSQRLDGIFAFKIKRQRGSHIILSKETPEGKIGTVVPNHAELKIGTLKGVLELAKVKEEDFGEYQ